ncbi:hypothetical protein F511_34591 [Dorcoceras hygrometricum]|uniref:Uncharacterized protein n=1 Tax=Dorcoceras hygrometricum TaxID=472368 RepID=A0A2Z7DEK1_9LAMI|nr:hypothetical protein F511_34591 [Dorcoceras hygrometricum]
MKYSVYWLMTMMRVQKVFSVIEEVKAEKESHATKAEPVSSNDLQTALSKITTENEDLRSRSQEMMNENQRLSEIILSWTKSSASLQKLQGAMKSSGLKDAGIDQLNFHSVQLDYLELLQMGNTDPNKTKAGNKYEVKPQYEELSKQLGGRLSNPVVTTPTIALDLSGATHQSASPNVAPNQLLRAAQFVPFLPSNYLTVPPGSNHAAGNFLEAEIQKLTLAEERTHRLFSKASKSSSFAFPLPAKYNFSNG